ncbi:MAG TPA: hypothetical protein VGD02_12035 [Gemmatimonadaceae bacterium]|jgi:hypothetical protein
MRALVLAGFALVVFASSSLSQSIELGSRVRVVASSLPGGVGVGKVIAADGDSLILERERSRGVARLARTDVSSIQVSAGHHRHVGRGALAGALIGAGSGALIGAVTWAPCTGFCFLEPTTRGENAKWGAAIVGTIGALVGTVAGAFIVSDEWQSLTLAPTVGLTTLNGKNAESFGLRLSRPF